LTVDKGGFTRRRPRRGAPSATGKDGALYRPQERLIVPMLMGETTSTVTV